MRLDASRQRRPGRRRRRLGLRARVTATFAIGALLLSGALASITYFAVRASLLRDQETTATREAVANALIVRNGLASRSVGIAELVAGLGSAPGTEALLLSDGQWFASVPTLGPAELPQPLVTMVTGGVPARQVIDLGGQPSLAIGLPIPGARVDYFQFVDLAQVSRTLHLLAATLALAALVTTIAGASVGRWAAGRALRPLHDVAEAALSIASGRFDTRLDPPDAADLAALASSFNRMADRLQERIARDARFTSDVSHELRSPLTTLAASVAVLESRAVEMPDRARQAVGLLSAEVRRFRRMVEELLEISRVDAGSAELTLDEVAIGELVAQAVASSGQSRVPVDVAPEVATRRLLVDKRRFGRIVANLLDNAARYAGGATRLTVETAGDAVRFAVEDAGPGIPEEERRHIFERFARGPAARTRGASEGAGLGLALVEEHVRLHGGRVWVEDRRGGGARFVVELPLDGRG